jgi:hypothetical protein
MGQAGFFDLERRLDALSAKGDPLETIKTTVPWETFRADIEAVIGTKDQDGARTETKPEERKRRPQALRHDPEVQDRGAAEPLQSVRRAD